MYRFTLNTVCHPYTVIDADPWKVLGPAERVQEMYEVIGGLKGFVRLFRHDLAVFWKQPDWQFQLRRVPWDELPEHCSRIP
jgi:hypothetical protein